jgi:pimeloyl-ACP methyl ester carboxylesterase
MTPDATHFTKTADSFWTKGPVRSSRRGQFWIAGERFEQSGHTYQRGPMYVSWEAPEKVTKPYPLVLVHGGATQGTEWMDTPDGRPGWAQRFVEDGYAVFVVERPSQGRSPFSPEIIGKMGPAFAYQEGETVFFPPETLKQHTQWLFSKEDINQFDEFVAAFGPLPEDITVWQTMDADRLAKLLDKIGPAVVITHSASGSDGWLVADRRPELVAGIIAVEPMGPPFGTTPNIGALSWGLTAIPVTYDPPVATPEAAKKADPATLKIPALKGKPVVVVSGEVSPQSKYAPEMVEFLKHAGAQVEALHLPDHEIKGNGHGLIYEKNSDETIKPVLAWLDRAVNK